MNWTQAEVAARNFWVRQESWTGSEMWRLHRGVWFWGSGGTVRVLEATDYDERIFSARDWTTMPKALAACPVDPGTGSSGGGSHVPDEPTSPPPSGGAGGGTPGAPTPPVGGGGGGATPGPPPPPPPPPKLKVLPLGCQMPSKTLTVLNNCNWGLDIELECSGFSDGSYSVIFTVGDQKLPGGIKTGPNFVAEASMQLNETYAGHEVFVYAQITGLNGGLCAGAQVIAPKKVRVQRPPECLQVCSTANQYIVQLIGVRINKDTPYDIRGEMTFSGVCGPSGRSFVTAATMNGNAARQLTAFLTFSCADGYYTATVTWTEPGGQSGTVFLTAEEKTLGAPLENLYNGDDSQFSGGAVIISPYKY